MEDLRLMRSYRSIIVGGIIVAVAIGIIFSLMSQGSITKPNVPTVEQPVTEPKGTVSVMYAGSLIRTFENKTGPVFQSETGYTYLGEGKGSVQVANMIIDQQRTPDVFVSAGTIPIKNLMDHDPPLARWLVRFASAEVVITYTPNSPFFNDLEKARKGELPWYQVISEDGFKFRRTDPELDPKGYYMIIVANLANLYYNDTTIEDRILGDDRNPEQLLPEETLKATLESGQIDACAAYKHEAVARRLPYITLPKEINLSEPAFTDFYKKASYTLGSGTIVSGGTIDFSVTIPEASKNIEGSTAFVKFMLSERGRDILVGDGLNPTKLVAEGNVENMPSEIRSMVVVHP